jgi:transposase
MPAAYVKPYIKRGRNDDRGREFSAWLGLTSRQNSSGGKDRLGRISKMGNRYLRSLIVVGAIAMIRYAREKGAVSADGSMRCSTRSRHALVLVAVANKTSRIPWVLLARGTLRITISKSDQRVKGPLGFQLGKGDYGVM